MEEKVDGRRVSAPEGAILRLDRRHLGVVVEPRAGMEGLAGAAFEREGAALALYRSMMSWVCFQYSYCEALM